jgi:CARDB protein
MKNGKLIRSKQLLLLAVLLMNAGMIAAQANGRNHPSPLVSNTIEGHGTGKKIEEFYTFTAGPGEVSITVDLTATSGSTGADVELFNSDNKIFFNYPNATTTTERSAKRISVNTRQVVILRLAFDASMSKYRVTLGGAVELTPSANPNSIETSPAVAQPDLIVADIAFGNQTGPSNVRVHITNQGNADSAECFLAFMSSKPTAAGQAEQRTWSVKVPAIAAGKSAFLRFRVTPLTEGDGPWQAVIDRSNTVKESNEGNNLLAYAPSSSTATSPANKPLPDLFVDSFELVNPETGQVKIVVTNRGGGPNSGPCQLRLIVWKPGKFEQEEAKTIFLDVPALHTGTSATIIATVGVPIINTRYSIFVDINHDVNEMNENNNRAEGEAGNYKP